jgi:hypothetical protein
MTGRFLIAALCLTGISAPALAAFAPRDSWGKAGVSLDQYRADAVMCGRRGYHLDVSGTHAAQTLVKASSQIENLMMGGGSNTGLDPIVMAVQGARPEQQFRAIATLQKTTVDGCLTDLGYVRFRLTDAQRDQLEKLRAGTPERHAYLHSLASDAKILSTQHL